MSKPIFYFNLYETKNGPIVHPAFINRSFHYDMKRHNLKLRCSKLREMAGPSLP